MILYNSMRQASARWWWSLKMTQGTQRLPTLRKTKKTEPSPIPYYYKRYFQHSIQIEETITHNIHTYIYVYIHIYLLPQSSSFETIWFLIMVSHETYTVSLFYNNFFCQVTDHYLPFSTISPHNLFCDSKFLISAVSPIFNKAIILTKYNDSS